MDENAKKTALRMIPYGLYVLTAEDQDGNLSAATVNWVTQASFEPPLVAVGVKGDSAAHAIIQESGSFALNVNTDLAAYDPALYRHQVPGGMRSNLEAQLETLGLSDKLPAVLEEITRIRAELGWPTLASRRDDICLKQLSRAIELGQTHRLAQQLNGSAEGRGHSVTNLRRTWSTLSTTVVTR